MKIENNYPKIKKQISKLIIFRKVFFILYLIAIITCCIVNLCVGGKAWCLYVVCAGILVYFGVFNKPLIDYNFLDKSSTFLFITCGYLYLINVIENQHWGYFVIMIILFSIIVLQATIYLSLYHQQKKNLMSIFWTIILGLVLTILAICGVIKINWPIIALGSFALFLLILFFTVFKKWTIKILQRKFHVK